MRLETLHGMHLTQIRQHWTQRTRLGISKHELENEALQAVLTESEQLAEEVATLEAESQQNIEARHLKLDLELRQDLLNLRDSLKKQKEASLFKV